METEKISLLITGGAGFIGSNLCEYLLGKGYRVICLDNLSTGFRHNLEAFMDHPDFKFIEGDIRDRKTCEQAVEGCDYVLHQAALGSVPRSIEDPCTSTDVNIGGFVNMLFAAAKAGVKRFVYAASSSTYGDHQQLPKIEHVIGKPLSPYAITKYVNEMIAENFTRIYGIETVGLRYFNVFGRRQNPEGAYAAVIPRFVQQLMRHESPVINGDGAHSRDFTYIDNVLQANELAAFTPKEELISRRKAYMKKNGLEEGPDEVAEVVNIAFGEQTSLVQLVDYLKEDLAEYDEAIKAVEPIFGPPRDGDIPHSLASIEKARFLLEYNPRYSVRDGIQVATTWYWQNL